MDVGLAAEYAVSDVVPMLTRGQFIDGSAGTASRALSIDLPDDYRFVWDSERIVAHSESAVGTAIKCAGNRRYRRR